GLARVGILGHAGREEGRSAAAAGCKIRRRGQQNGLFRREKIAYKRGEEDQQRTATMKRLVRVCAAAALAASIPSIASAEDTLKVAIGQINNWENQAPTLGSDAGIFKAYSLIIDAVGTAGAGETLQPVISGSADLGVGVGMAGAMRAYAKGAPV